eukprot:SAG31_NODE_4427_length_3241_cov_1.992680_5_plen_41_part_01
MVVAPPHRRMARRELDALLDAMVQAEAVFRSAQVALREAEV